MDTAQLHALLLVEVHRYIATAAAEAVGKLGRRVPEAAIDGYITRDEQAQIRNFKTPDFTHPVFRKSLDASVARINTLSYPPGGAITPTDAQALESLTLTDAQAVVLERVVAEAAHTAFFNFFALLDAAGDPELTHVQPWAGANFAYARADGPLLHGEFALAYDEYQKKVEA